MRRLFIRLLFASGSFAIFLAKNDYPSATLRLGNGGEDFNFLEFTTAQRFYCEYKIRERIHRDVDDSRLLVIPASWSQVADSNPN